ncbi:glycosyltransferase family 4 protein [Amorphus sp. 3PC139-8]|uniref:glycosyltransferase family 4 protein n=1 Tax=Amorphus sp. 3PC139-8 TaxID=2735676 RepID=UPI00345D5AAF
MRIVVVRTQVPFVNGGAERHGRNLCLALERHGHEATEVTLPFRWYPGTVLVDHILSAKLVNLERFEGAPVDLMVGLKFPAWLAHHPNKVFWVLHQHRQAYDFWESGISDLLGEPDAFALRELIQAEDRSELGRANARVYANSGNVAARMKRFLGIESKPLYHPPPNADRLRPGSYGDYLLVPGRINTLKRQALVLDAVARAGAPLRVVFAGPPDSQSYLDELRQKAIDLGIDRSVEWLGGISDEHMIELYAGARAVIYTPVDEDYGYVSLEGMLSAKPLIVTTDCGGPLEFVRHGKEGWICDPTAEALADAIKEAADDPALCERMGLAGCQRYADFDISWDTAVECLTRTSAPRSDARLMPRRAEVAAGE